MLFGNFIVCQSSLLHLNILSESRGEDDKTALHYIKKLSMELKLLYKEVVNGIEIII